MQMHLGDGEGGRAGGWLTGWQPKRSTDYSNIDKRLNSSTFIGAFILKIGDALK